MTIAKQSTSLPTSTAPKTKKLPAKWRKAIRMVIQDEMPKETAAKKLHMSKRTLYHYAKTPQGQAYIAEMVAIKRTLLQPEAVNVQAGLMVQATSERVRLEASKCFSGGDSSKGFGGNTVLNVAGSVHITPGYVIDLTDPGPNQPKSDGVSAKDKREAIEG